MVDYRFNTAVLRTPRVRRWGGAGWSGGGQAEKDRGVCSKVSKSREDQGRTWSLLCPLGRIQNFKRGAARRGLVSTSRISSWQ